MTVLSLFSILFFFPKGIVYFCLVPIVLTQHIVYLFISAAEKSLTRKTQGIDGGLKQTKYEYLLI